MTVAVSHLVHRDVLLWVGGCVALGITPAYSYCHPVNTLVSTFRLEPQLAEVLSHATHVRNGEHLTKKLIISSPDLASVGRQGARDDAGSISARHQVFTIIAIPIITITIITITTTMSRTTVLPVQQCAVLSARTMRAVTTLLFLQVIFILMTFIQAF